MTTTPASTTAVSAALAPAAAAAAAASITAAAAPLPVVPPAASLVTPPTATRANPVSSKIDNWIKWFDSRPSSEFINKQSMEDLFKAFNASVSDDDVKQKLQDHQETLFLFKEAFGIRINMFHHVKILGGTVYDSNVQIGFIQGVHKDMATTMTPDIDVLCSMTATAAIPVPTVTDILKASNLAEIDALTNGTTTTYKPRNFIPIIPFLCQDISEMILESQGDCKATLLKVIQSIKAFDTSHSGDATYQHKAKGKCKDILYWLYLNSQNIIHIKAVPTTVSSTSRIRDEFKSIEKSCIESETAAVVPSSMASFANHLGAQLKRPLEMVGTSMSSNQDVLRQLSQLQSQSNEKSSKSFTKLPPKYQNMIRVASSRGEVTAMEINETAKEFFKSTTLLNANIFLNSILEGENIDCSISMAMTTALMCGSFLWFNPMTPSGLASSVIISEDIMRTDTLHEGMVLDLTTKFEMSQSSIEKLTKAHIKFPDTAEGTIERLRALKALCCLFLEDRSLPSQGLRSLVNKCTDNKSLLRTRAAVDEEFYAKLLCCVDDRLYQWLKECSRASCAAETTTMLTDFGSIFTDIQMNQFHYLLPPKVKRTKNRSDDRVDGRGKRQRMDQQAAKRIVNPRIVPSWKLRQNEKWDTIFRGQSKSGPDLAGGYKPCLKYHVKGFCYDDCAFAKNHEEVKVHDKEKTDKFIKSLRGE